jgi:hypothetical protein
MLRRVLIGLTGATLSLITCVGVASAQGATTETTIQTVHFEDPRGSFVCVDEPVGYSGDISVTTHVTETPSGGVTLIQTSRFVRYTGVGLITGQRYASVGSGFGNQSSHEGSDGLPFTTTGVIPAHLIAQGPPDPGVRFALSATFHTTVNPDGTVVVDNVKFDEQCR